MTVGWFLGLAWRLCGRTAVISRRARIWVGRLATATTPDPEEEEEAPPLATEESLASMMEKSRSIQKLLARYWHIPGDTEMARRKPERNREKEDSF